MSNTVVTSAFGQEGNIFSICCSTDGFLLDFLRGIITANVFLTSSKDLVYDGTPAYHDGTPAYHSRRKKHHIFNMENLVKNKSNEDNLLTSFWGRM
jgi:hypothetical protein